MHLESDRSKDTSDGLSRRGIVIAGFGLLALLAARSFLRKRTADRKNTQPAEPVREKTPANLRIMACVGSEDSFKPKNESGGTDDTLRALKDELRPELVDFFAEPHILDSQGIKHAGPMSYAISPATPANKESADYINCIGVVIVGRDKATGKNISLLTHQDPRSFLDKDKEKFGSDFLESLRDFKSRVEAGTTDAVIVGGNFHEFINDLTSHTYAEDYVSSVSLIDDLIAKELGIEVSVPVGPDMRFPVFKYVRVIFDTERRRLYIIRPDQKESSANAGFSASEVKERAKSWTEKSD